MKIIFSSQQGRLQLIQVLDDFTIDWNQITTISTPNTDWINSIEELISISKQTILQQVGIPPEVYAQEAARKFRVEHLCLLCLPKEV